MGAQILVPLDGTPRAEAILAPVVPLAQATGAGLTLLQAVPGNAGVDPVVGMQGPPDPIQLEPTAFWDAAESYLRNLAQGLERPDWPVGTVVLEGAPASAVLDYVGEHPEVRLIALATHGRRGTDRLLLGSVAEDILHHAPVPVLVLRQPGNPAPAGAEPVFRTIVVPLDGSPFAEYALDQAKALATATGARLVLVSAAEGVDDAQKGSGEMPGFLRQERQAEVDRLVLYQQGLAARLASEGVHVSARMGDGFPAEVILNLSDEVKADLIVMATHGRTGFQRFRLGSVALDVVEHATRPVFLVRVRQG